MIFFSFVQRVLNGRNLRDFREVLPIAWKKRKQRIIILSKGMAPYNKPLTLTLKLLTLLALDSTGEYQPYFITSFYYRPYFPASAWICHPYAQSVRNYYSFIFLQRPSSCTKWHLQIKRSLKMFLYDMEAISLKLFHHVLLLLIIIYFTASSLLS